MTRRRQNCERASHEVYGHGWADQCRKGSQPNNRAKRGFGGMASVEAGSDGAVNPGAGPCAYFSAPEYVSHTIDNLGNVCYG